MVKDSSEKCSDNKIDKRNDQQKKKVVITGDSMLNGLHEKGLSMNHKVKVVPAKQSWTTSMTL